MVCYWGSNVAETPAPDPVSGKIKRPKKGTDVFGNYDIIVYEPQLMPGDAGYIKGVNKKRLCNHYKSKELKCTRGYNHNGPHVAHGLLGKMIASWYSEVEQICLQLEAEA